MYESLQLSRTAYNTFTTLYETSRNLTIQNCTTLYNTVQHYTQLYTTI